MPIRSSSRRHRTESTGRSVGFFRARGGATAVEFALVVFPFLILVTGILDTAMLFWASQTLDDALADAARTVQTGQFQGANAGETDPARALTNLRNELCRSNGAERWTLFTCSDVKLELRVYDSIAAGKTMTPLDPQTRNWSPDFGKSYTNAQASTIVVIQAAVKYPSFSFTFPMTTSFADGSRLVQSVQVFRTEPF